MYHFIFALLCLPVLSSSMKINPNTHIDYLCDYNETMRYSTALDENYILNTTSNIEGCLEDCSEDNDCRGYFSYTNNNTNLVCNQLNNLGSPISNLVNGSQSCRKVLRYDSVLDYSIYGRIRNNVDDIYNTRVYLDYNFNGRYDNNEPYIYTNNTFIFSNLTDGNYLVRIELDDHCNYKSPNIFGYSYNNNNLDGYVNSVSQYHSNNGHIVGGLSGLEPEYLDNFDYILDGLTNTYITFYTNDTIILDFTKSVIIDQPGNDIFFNLDGQGDLNAHVSISADYGDSFTYLGILNKENVAFNLASINYESVVYHIYLHFFGNDTLSITSVLGNTNNLNSPPYAYYISSTINYELFFRVDCDYQVECTQYCDNHMYSWDNYLSCMEGCYHFDLTDYCDCSTVNRSEIEYFSYYYYHFGNIDNFEEHSCEHGCDYKMQQYIWPNYTLARGVGDINSLVDSVNCTNNTCIDELIESCDYNSECHSIQMEELDGGLLLNTHNYASNNESIFMIKNSARHLYNTISPTLSPIGSPTLSPSGSPTISPSGSPTISPSGSPTISPSGSPTISPTLTPIRSPTLSPSDSPTELITTSQTTPYTTTTITTKNTELPIDNNSQQQQNDSSNIEKIVLYILFALILISITIGFIYFKFIKRPVQRDEGVSFSNPVFQADPVNPTYHIQEDISRSMDNKGYEIVTGGSVNMCEYDNDNDNNYDCDV